MNRTCSAIDPTRYESTIERLALDADAEGVIRGKSEPVRAGTVVRVQARLRTRSRVSSVSIMASEVGMTCQEALVPVQRHVETGS